MRYMPMRCIPVILICPYALPYWSAYHCVVWHAGPRMAPYSNYAYLNYAVRNSGRCKTAQFASERGLGDNPVRDRLFPARRSHQKGDRLGWKPGAGRNLVKKNASKQITRRSYIASILSQPTERDSLFALVAKMTRLCKST
jgi:hypothetical protein